METGNISQDVVSPENQSDLKVSDYNDAGDCVRTSPDNDCDTDSTIVYALDVKDETFDIALYSPAPEENYFPTSKSVSSDLRTFSPLPSTSSDNIIIDINNTRFNEASGLSTSSPNSPENRTTIDSSNHVIECSSGSQDSDTALTVIRDKKRRSKRKKMSLPDVIDLLLDDVDTKIYDSDCEIIDVDQLIADNNAVLNSSQSQEVIQLENTAPEPRALKSPPAAPPPLESSVHFTTEPAHSTPTTPSVDLYTSPQMEHLNYSVMMRKQVKDFFDKHSPLYSKDQDVDSPSLSNSVFNVMSSLIKIPFNYATRKGKKRERKDKNTKNKQSRVLETIDLDLIRNSNQQQSSEVIVIDSDTSINAGCSSNVDSPYKRRPNVQSPKRRKTQPGRSQHSAECRGCDECCVPWYGYEGHNALLGSNRSTVPQIMQTMELISPDNSLLNMMSSLNAPPPPVPTTPSKSYGECPVCMESLQKVNAVSTFCGHIFCETCIKKVKLSSKKCPTCRKVLRGKGYHQIFL